MTSDPTNDETPTIEVADTPDDEDTGSDIDPDDRVPLDEINEQTDVMLTSFFDAANAMDTWHRKLEEVDVPVPKTRMIDLEDGTQAYLGMSQNEITPLFMSEDPDLKMDFIGRPAIGVDGIKDLIETEFNGDEVFVRSYHKSARHLDAMAGQIEDPTIQNIKMTIAALLTPRYFTTNRSSTSKITSTSSRRTPTTLLKRSRRTRGRLTS